MLGFGTLQRVVTEIRADVASARDRDPAARGVGTAEILMNWGGVQAILSTASPTHCTRPGCRWCRWRSPTRAGR